MEVFLNVRDEIMKDLGVDKWSGTWIENSAADLKVSKCIRNSFRNYETKKSKNSDVSYFKF